MKYFVCEEMEKEFDVSENIVFFLDDSAEEEAYYCPEHIPDQVKERFVELFQGTELIMTVVLAEGNARLALFQSEVYENMLEETRAFHRASRQIAALLRLVMGRAVQIESSAERKIPVIEHLFRQVLPRDTKMPRQMKCCVHHDGGMAILFS